LLRDAPELVRVERAARTERTRHMFPDQERVGERRTADLARAQIASQSALRFFAVVQTSQGTVSLSSSSMLPLLILFVLFATDLWSIRMPRSKPGGALRSSSHSETSRCTPRPNGSSAVCCSGSSPFRCTSRGVAA